MSGKKSSDGSLPIQQQSLEGELLGPEEDNPHRIPDIFHKDGTLNYGELRERNRRVDEWLKHHHKSDDVWFEELKRSRHKEEREDIRDAWIASIAPFLIAGVVAIVLLVLR